MVGLLRDKAATEVTGGTQLVDVLVWRVQDSFIPPYVLGLGGWLWAGCTQMRLRPESWHVASPDDSLRVFGLLMQWLRLKRLFQEPKAEAAGLQMAQYWQSQNLISPAISASGKSSQSSSDSRDDTIFQWEKQHRFCNHLWSTAGVNGSSVSAQPLGGKPLGEPEATGCLLPLCTLLRARNLLSKSGPNFFFRK